MNGKSKDINLYNSHVFVYSAFPGNFPLLTFPQPLHLSLVFRWGWYLSWWLGSSHRERSACNAGDQVQLLGQEDPLEKGMATHSRILAWRIPWTEKPGRLHPWSCKELHTTQQLTLSLLWIQRALSLYMLALSTCS